MLKPNGHCDIDLRGVISNVPDAPGLERASAAGIPVFVVDHRRYTKRAAFETALIACIDSMAPQLVVLAGFMRILGPELVTHYAGRMINIHPSLLPQLPGLDTHRRALAAGLREHGVSIHYVTADLDGGPLIAQAKVSVLDGDDEAQLAARVLIQEHQLLPRVIAGIAQGQIRLENGQAVVEGTLV